MLVKLFGAAVQGIDATIVTRDFRTLLSRRATNVSYPLCK